MTKRPTIDVAILTRSEDRVQHGIESACQTTESVAILTRSEDRVQRPLDRWFGDRVRVVAILTRSEDRVQPGHRVPVRRGVDVAILTRSEDRVQRVDDFLAAGGTVADLVAILTRSEDRVQRQIPIVGPALAWGCDPHPVRRPGAAPRHMPDRLVVSGLRSSPGPKTGCSSPAQLSLPGRPWCCDPHPVRRPGAASGRAAARALGVDVAILTRSEDRVQPAHVAPAPDSSGVAILTRSEDRVQRQTAPEGLGVDSGLRSSPGPKTGCSLFDTGVRPRPAALLRSSPGPKTGCSPTSGSRPRSAWMLRSSPGPKTGCSTVGTVEKGAEYGCCDPHPVRRPGAARPKPAPRCRRGSCDPHPVRRPGAAGPGGLPGPGVGRVAILTRSEDRVQPRHINQPRAQSNGLRSSPGPKTGCSARRGGVVAVEGVVAILTRSEDRVQARTGRPADPG